MRDGRTIAQAAVPQNEDQPRVLVVDDEESMRYMLREVMSREGYFVEIAANGAEAVQRVREAEYDLVILDMKMPVMDGLQALQEIRRIDGNAICVMITAFGNQETTLDALRKGAYDYFSKPFELEEMRMVIRRAIERRRLIRKVTQLEERLRERFSFDRIIGRSDAMQQVYEMIQKVVANDVTVMITGESGTGKELVAQAIHYHSRRKSKAFVSVNCAAIPENLLESELFGHERGAFTGAVATKVGRFETAQGGTIMLDEIGDMPLSLQGKMLRVLQEREMMRVGGTKAIKIDVRVIAATNQDLARLVEEKRFREDLYFRLNVLPIHLPPLRRRQADIPLLVDHFVRVHNPRLQRNVEGASRETMDILEKYDWPGNVRELENVIQRAMILAPENLLRPGDLPANVREFVPKEADVTRADEADEYIEDFSIPLQQKIDRMSEEVEKRVIRAALKKANYRRQATADLLGISRKSLHNKMVRYQLFAEETQGDNEDSA